MAGSHDNKFIQLCFNTSPFYHSYFNARRCVPPVLLWLSLCVFLLGGCSSMVPQHAQVSTAAAKGQQTQRQFVYVAMGASDTFGFGTADPYHQNWATDLAARLGSRYRLVNLGIPSIVVHEALTVELPVALDAHPDLVTIWLAVNDIIDRVPVDRYAQDLDTLVSRLQANAPHARIAVANVPDLALLPYFTHQDAIVPQLLQAQVLAYNTAIADIVGRHHAILIDLSQHDYDLEHHPEYVSQDGLHPTATGYARLAALFYQALSHQD